MRDLTDFLGAWTLSRSIAHADGTEAQFDGVATWTAEGGGARYLESGYLILPQARLAAERRYLWDADLNVFFDDGRFFHTVPPEGGQTGHWCDPDQYDVAYDFSTWPDWSCRWQVQGPRKNYVMTSRYRRS